LKIWKFSNPSKELINIIQFLGLRLKLAFPKITHLWAPGVHSDSPRAGIR